MSESANANVKAYIDALYRWNEDEALARVLASIRERGMPEISVPPGYGRLITLLAAASGASAALEIGALGGYSGICILRGLRPDGVLISLELKAEYAELARANVAAAGFGGRAEYRVGEALARLPELAEEGKTFDFIFIDADKENYPKYLDWALKLARPGAIIAADNTLLRGRVAEEGDAAGAPSVSAMREFNARMAADPRLVSVLLPAYDGLTVARVMP